MCGLGDKKICMYMWTTVVLMGNTNIMNLEKKYLFIQVPRGEERREVFEHANGWLPGDERYGADDRSERCWSKQKKS